MKRPVSLRTRLAFGAAAAVLIVSSLAGYLQYRILTNGQYARVDSQLDSILDLAPQGAGLIGFARKLGDDPNVAQLDEAVRGVVERTFGSLADEQAVTVEIVTPSGERVAVSGEPIVTPVVPYPPPGGMPSGGVGTTYFYSAESGGVPVRVGARPAVDRSGNPWVFLASRSIADLQNAQRGWAQFLFLEVGLVVLLSGAAAFAVAWGALRPVRRMSETAQAIADTGDLARRVPPTRTDRDLQNLADTFNVMLDQVERAYERITTALDAERRFVADASHELRTPLTTIMGNVDYLARTGADPEALDDIRASSERLTQLVSKLTQLAREESGVGDEPVELDLSELILDVVAEPSYQDSGAHFSVDVAPGVWVRGVELSLASVVRNLVGNAVKYGAGEVRVQLGVQGSLAVLDVVDNGAGLTAGEVEHVFERFWRSDGAKGTEGSGLGLSIVRSGVETHKGTVKALPGPGGRFRVELPTTPAPPREPVDSGAIATPAE